MAHVIGKSYQLKVLLRESAHFEAKRYSHRLSTGEKTMEFQEKIAKYTGHQLNSLADVRAILAVAGKMDHGHVKTYMVLGGPGDQLSVNITVMGCTVEVNKGEWLLHKPTGDGDGILFTLTQEQMDEHYEAVPLVYKNMPKPNLGSIINDQIRQQRERDVQLLIKRRPVYNAENHSNNQWGKL